MKKNNFCQNINNSFQLFGADIAVNNKLEPLLIEINKGPSLDAKDERDKMVKMNVVTDIFALLNIIDKKGHDFEKIDI